MSASENKFSHIAFHDKQILAAAGNNPNTVRNLLRKYSLPVPTVQAVYQWVSRKNIPDTWRAALIYCLLSEQMITIKQLFCRDRVPASADKTAHVE